MGASALHGPHHVAQKSISTGWSDFNTAWSKLASVTSKIASLAMCPPEEAVELLATAEWPGNVRQLYNVVCQNVALSHGPIITAEIVQQSLGGGSARLPSFDEARDEFTRNYLSQILQLT